MNRRNAMNKDYIASYRFLHLFLLSPHSLRYALKLYRMFNSDDPPASSTRAWGTQVTYSGMTNILPRAVHCTGIKRTRRNGIGSLQCQRLPYHVWDLLLTFIQAHATDRRNKSTLRETRS